MVRPIALVIAGLSVIANLSAGPVLLPSGSIQTQVGGANGLTTVQATGNITSTQAGPLPYSATVLQGTGSATGNTITSGVLCYGFAPTATTSCTAGGGTLQTNLPYTSSNPVGGASYYSSGVTFSMINQGNASEWTTTNLATGTSTIDIPIGIFGVTNVETMLNDNFGKPGTSNISVKFQFGSTATTGDGASLTFNLVDGKTIRSSFECLAGTTGNGCLTYLTGGVNTLDTTNMFDTAGSSLGLITSTAVPNVSSYNVITGTYNAPTAGAIPYKGTSGNLYLDAQNFYLGSAGLGAYLTSITINDTVTASLQSRAELSAITVFSNPREQQASATPEPSTVLLGIAGVGAIALVRRRKSQLSS